MSPLRKEKIVEYFVPDGKHIFADQSVLLEELTDDQALAGANVSHRQKPQLIHYEITAITGSCWAEPIIEEN